MNSNGRRWYPVYCWHCNAIARVSRQVYPHAGADVKFTCEEGHSWWVVYPTARPSSPRLDPEDEAIQ